MTSTGVAGFPVTLHNRQPAPWRLALVVISRLEHRRSQRRFDVQRGRAAVGKTMLAAGRNDDKLSAGQRDVTVINPDVGPPVANAQHFLDGMQVGRRALPRIAPLLEQTELRRAICRRCLHARPDTRTPRSEEHTSEL